MPRTTKLHDYLPVGDREMDWGLYVTVVGFNRVLPGEPFPSPKHPGAYRFDPDIGRYLPEYQLFFITKGNGVFSSESTGEIPLAEGSALLLFPNVWHSYRPDVRTGWEDYWVGFNGSYVHELCRRNVLSPERPLFTPPNRDDLTDVFENLLGLVRAEPMENSLRHSALALEILAIATETKKESKEESLGKKKIVEDAIQIIWGWSYRVLDVNLIARQLGIQRRTLERYFREIRGTTILQEIMQCRLARACRMLEETRVPIGQIALMTGFSSVQQMRRNFHQFYGKPPETFRKRPPI